MTAPPQSTANLTLELKRMEPCILWTSAAHLSLWASALLFFHYDLSLTSYPFSFAL